MHRRSHAAGTFAAGSRGSWPSWPWRRRRRWRRPGLSWPPARRRSTCSCARFPSASSGPTCGRARTVGIIESRGDLSQPLDIREQVFQIEYDAGLHPAALRVAGVRRDLPFSLVTHVRGRHRDLGAGRERAAVYVRRRPGSRRGRPARLLLRRLRGAGAASGGCRPRRRHPRLRGAAHPHPGPGGAGPGAADGDARGGGHRCPGVRRVVRARRRPGGGGGVDGCPPPPAAGLHTACGRRPDSRRYQRRRDPRSRPHPRRGTRPSASESEGFGLAATVTVPVDRPRPVDGWPAVLLVSGPGAPDRDGTLSGVPVLGQLASALADAGFLVARYDRRGTGRSGGRPESAGVEEYAEDARRMVRYLDDRDDVDRDRITVVGQAEGGWVGDARRRPGTAGTTTWCSSGCRARAVPSWSWSSRPRSSIG